MSIFKFFTGILVYCSWSATALCAEGSPNEWITLGTMGGPVPNALHSQPSNALVVNGHIYVVDAGDGTAGQLSKAGLSIKNVDAVFISHLHFDHIGGLPALISLRWQTSANNMLTIYGPPGIKQTVEGIFSFMNYGAQGNYGVSGQIAAPSDHNVRVVELHDGARIELSDFKLSAVRNSHYSWPKESEEWQKFQALSFKFELPEFQLVYTGDTGPSENVVKLAQNVDLLISEMMDVEQTINLIKQLNPEMPSQALQHMSMHLFNHHLTPEEVGKLTMNAKAGKLIVTHMAPGLVNPTEYSHYANLISAHYNGSITIAKDLDRFILQR